MLRLGVDLHDLLAQLPQDVLIPQLKTHLPHSRCVERAGDEKPCISTFIGYRRELFRPCPPPHGDTPSSSGRSQTPPRSNPRQVTRSSPRGARTHSGRCARAAAAILGSRRQPVCHRCRAASAVMRPSPTYAMHLAASIVRGDACKGDRPRRGLAVERPPAVDESGRWVLAEFEIGDERLRPVAAMEEHALVRVVAVVVVPVGKGACAGPRPTGGRTSRPSPVASASHAAGRRLLVIMLMMVQALNPKLFCIESQHWMAAPCRPFWSIQSPRTTDSRDMRKSGSCGASPTVTYVLISSSFCPTLASDSGSRSTRPRTSDRSITLTLTPDASSSFSLNRTVLNALGRVPTTPSRAPRIPRTTRQTADKPLDLAFERLARRVERVHLGQAKWVSVLAQVVANRDLAAEGIPSRVEAESPNVVGKGMHQYRHLKP